ncbi:hypothetical protein BS78_05G230700, partial [Paspalum vaginatum]
MDFIESLPKSEGCDTILVVVDRFTKYSHFIALHHPFTAQTRQYLKWRQWLPMAQFWYNSSFHSALGCSPFKALCGYDPSVIASPPGSSTLPTTIEDWIVDKQAHDSMLKEMLAAAQNRTKYQADKHKTDRVFQVGEQVLLPLQPYAQHSVVNRPCLKLALKFYGPYTVLERIGQTAYHLELPADAMIHPVFHVSQLKPFTPNYTPVYHDLPQVVDLDQYPLQPEVVLQRRFIKKGNAAVPQVLVKWTNLPADAATWEDYYVVKKQFP